MDIYHEALSMVAMQTNNSGVEETCPALSAHNPLSEKFNIAPAAQPTTIGQRL